MYSFLSPIIHVIKDDIEEQLADAEEFFDEPIPTSPRVEVSSKISSRPVLKKTEFRNIKATENGQNEGAMLNQK